MGFAQYADIGLSEAVVRIILTDPLLGAQSSQLLWL